VCPKLVTFGLFSSVHASPEADCKAASDESDFHGVYCNRSNPWKSHCNSTKYLCSYTLMALQSLYENNVDLQLFCDRLAVTTNRSARAASTRTKTQVIVITKRRTSMQIYTPLCNLSTRSYISVILPTYQCPPFSVDNGSSWWPKYPQLLLRLRFLL